MTVITGILMRGLPSSQGLGVVLFLPTIPKDVEEMFKEEAERSGVTVEELLAEIISMALNKPPSLKPAGRRLSEALREFREEVLKIEGVVDVVIPDEEFHESNVLVVISRVDLRVIEEIVEAKFSVEERCRDEITINPYIVLEGEEVISKVKEASRFDLNKGSRS
jgi:hypothetical protein